MPAYFPIAALVVFLFFTTGFIIAQLKRDNSFADVLWGAGFVVLSIVLLTVRTIDPNREVFYSQLWTVFLVTVWGVRLTWMIGKRNLKTGEDYRYRQMREKWQGSVRVNAFFKVFMLQGFFQYIIALPIIFIFAYPVADATTKSAIGIAVGVGVWLTGFLIEAIADMELATFKRKPEMKGRILKTGLWRYSRHPNYFGEALLWWGLFILVAFNSQFPLSLISIIGPITITVLVRYISGVPLLEKRMMQKEEYRDYASRTSIFIPLPPRKKKKNKNKRE